ncbi:MAG: T9SS type A sorting domain-containing protein [Bacteroidales bacterium]|nr:T9SS type A sorting domain-containing protein [Bacteroidales bacterium]
MKKFYMILAALLIGSVCFAQKTFTVSERYETTNPATAERSAWVGNQSGSNILGITTGHAIIMRGEQFSSSYAAGNTITKVKFSTCDPQNITGQGAATYASYTNNNFTIKIYEGGQYSDEYLTDGAILYTDGCYGTEAYSQAYTQTAFGENVVELTTPYTIGSTNFWIVIECAGNTVFLMDILQVGDAMPIATWQQLADASITSQNYMYSETYTPQGSSQSMEIVNNNALFYQETETTIQTYGAELCLAFYVDDGGAYIENSDITAGFLAGETAPYQAAETNITLGANDPLTVYPYIQNIGPDATSASVNISFSINNQEIISQPMDLSGENSLAAGYFTFIYGYQDPNDNTVIHYDITLTAEELDQMSLPSNFDVCLTATYAGVDNNANNNTACLHITRNVVSVEENIAEAVSVYPNPANDMFTVANAEGATIVVVNSLGQVVASIENAASNQTIDASNFANGTYFVKVNESVVKINVVK